MLQITLLILLDIVLVVLGQFFMKFGMNKVGNFGEMPFAEFLTKSLSSYLVLIGIVLYAVSAIVWLAVLSKVDLSFAYPMLSFGYILILLISYFLLGENITVLRILGVALIMIGIFFLYQS
jgi:multidrug transporter EmrE-like cation transporter